MQSTSTLRSILVSTIEAPSHAQTTEQDLYEELMAHKPILLNLFDAGKRSQEQQRALESGKITIRKKPMAVNADFSRQALFISQQLDCSEQYAAELLHDVMSTHPNLAQDRCVETTIIEHHTRRRHVAECLKYVLEAARSSLNPDAPPLYERLSVFARDQLLIRQPQATPLTEKLLNEVEKIGETLNRVYAERQNAGSATVAPTQAGQAARLGFDILNARRESLEYERALLSTLLFTIAGMGYLSGAEISRVVDWLKANSRHPVVFYYLPTILTALDIVDPDSAGAQMRRKLVSDANFVKQMNAILQVDNAWSEPGLKATILLKWTVFLTETRHRDPDLEEKEGFKAEQLESSIWNAVQGDCFPYLTRLLLRLHRGSEIPLPASLAQAALQDLDVQGESPLADFGPCILGALEVVVRSLISHASSELRKVKQRQEDLLVAGMRDRSKTWRSASQSTGRHPSGGEPSSEPAKPPRNDVAALFSFIGLLYSSLPPDHALGYWGAAGPVKSYADHVEASARKLPGFLQWAVWSTQPQNLTMLTALYDMLTGLATGERCSELAYNFLAKGGADGIADASTTLHSSQAGATPAVSWTSMFSVLETWAATGSPPRTHPSSSIGAGVPGSSLGDTWQNQPIPQHQAHQSQPRLSLSQQDVLVAQAFLHLLSTVATHSVAVRATIYGHARFRAIPTLVSLIPLSIPLELKATLFETLSSFCQPAVGDVGPTICKTVWGLMERLELINVRGGAVGATAASVRGVEVELEEVESAYKVYPATIAFIKLLSTLIHTPKSLPLQSSLTAGSIVTIPEGLGHSYRAPGIAPYIHFVVDNVFSSIPRREYLNPSDRWRMNDVCLSFIERCLASFDLEHMAAHQEVGSTGSETVTAMAHHPGYDIMKRLLTQSSLQATVLSYVAEGTDGFDKGLAEEQPFFRRTIIRVLRIILRVLEIEDIFLDVLTPLLSEASDKGLLQDIHPASYYVKLSQALFFAPDFISTIASYVAYPNHPEARLLSVKIMSLLAGPNTVRQLGVIIDRSVNSAKILNGFLSIISAESWVDVEVAEIEVSRYTGAGAIEEEPPAEVVAQAIRLALLDFLVANVNADRPYPNLAHYILFGELGQLDQIRDPGAVDGQVACIHALLDLLNKGVDSPSAEREEISEEPLFVVLPGLAERCYGVIHQLCKHPSTTVFVSRYLRSRENFFVRHLRAVPCKVPPVTQDASAEVVYHDGSRTATTVSSLCSFLRLRSHILELVALELHVLTTHGQHKAVDDLLAVLFESEGTAMQEDRGLFHNDMFKPFKEVGQAQSKIIELLQRLDFDWSDGLAVQAVELQFLSQLNLLSCLYVDRVGCQVVDRAALLTLLSDARVTLHNRGHLVTPAHAEQLSGEITYVLQSCAVENHRRQVQHAVSMSFEAWGDVLNAALLRCFSRIPPSQQETILLDLLHILPSSLQSDRLSQTTTVILAEAMVTTLAKIREVTLQSRGIRHSKSVSLPPERLHAFLRTLLRCIANPSRSQVVRGNLSACLVHYLHLVLLLDQSSSPSSASQHTSSNTWISGSVELIRPLSERLANVISRDASDGAEVWRTVALLALDTLVRFCEVGCNFTSSLSRHGHLDGFVKSIKESDAQLQEVLRPTSNDLNALYAYEAAMSLLNRVVQSKSGANQLMTSGVMKALQQCDFLDARPERETEQVDDSRDGEYLPSVFMRYHQMLMPALQLSAGISLAVDPDHVSATQQILEFLSIHRDALVSLLRNRDAHTSANTLEDIDCLIVICTTIVQGVPYSELHSATGYGSIHAAILNFTAHFWSSFLREDAASDGLSASRIRLLQTILLYSNITDDLPDFKRMFAANFSPSSLDTGSSSFNSPGPTLGDGLGIMSVLASQITELPHQQNGVKVCL
ncbi:hypothetical protein EIP91_009419 [Steccherinum ochraceum]|uniref:Uncharacterized protein n=1 Tax=Steccherinum ochraceum TaxID=92696 RepID=A0A4R0R1N3_9APHY|nr:hypothetical protein EIP91_009419 [Steccherinum ochraceum]